MAKTAFDLKKEIEKYAAALTADIFSPKKRAEVKREYAEHIEDTVYRYKLSGMSDKEAFGHACEDMGEIKKVRGLLAGVHNNKLQFFIVEMVLSKVRRVITNRRFLRGLLLFAIGFCVAFAVLFYGLISVIGGDSFVRGTVEFLSRLMIALRVFIPLVVFLIALFLLFPVFSLLYPHLRLFFERCVRYPSLFFWCLLHGYSFKLRSFKFCNSNKINACPNIVIRKNGKLYGLHFLDIPKAHKKVFILVNDSEYRIYDTERRSRESFIRNNYYVMENEDIPKVFRGANRIMDEESYSTYKFPDFSESDGIEHIVLIFPKFAYTKYMLENRLVDISGETKIVGMVFQKYKAFKKNKYF